MGRKATGSAWFDPRAKCWVAIVTLPNKSRKWVKMRDLTDPSADDVARYMASVVSKRLRDGDMVDEGTGETLSEYFERWVAARVERGIVTVGDDRGRFSKWVAPMLGAREAKSIAARDLEIFVGKLDTDVRAGKLSWKTAVHVWGLLTKLFDDARRSKDIALRVRTDNPARDVRGPDRGDDRARAFLSPTELAALLSCERVSTARRCIYAIGVYTGMRAGELCALTWDDVHEDDGYIHVHRALNRKAETHALKATKTGLARKVQIEPALLPLLEIMRENATTANVLPKIIASRSLPIFLREDLKAAGVERRELFDDTATTRKLDFHDLRHTYGTWRAIRGDDVIKIRFAMGHTDLKTTQRYINEAQVFDVARFGVPFGPLPLESLRNRWQQRYKMQKRRENEWVERDSNAPAPTASLIANHHENKPIAEQKPSKEAEQNVATPSVETLRAKLDAAIVAERWEAVAAIQQRIVEVEREGVVDFAAERARRRGR